jgi:hypothetical protein
MSSRALNERRAEEMFVAVFGHPPRAGEMALPRVAGTGVGKRISPTDQLVER